MKTMLGVLIVAAFAISANAEALVRPVVETGDVEQYVGLSFNLSGLFGRQLKKDRPVIAKNHYVEQYVELKPGNLIADASKGQKDIVGAVDRGDVAVPLNFWGRAEAHVESNKVAYTWGAIIAGVGSLVAVGQDNDWWGLFGGGDDKKKEAAPASTEDKELVVDVKGNQNTGDINYIYTAGGTKPNVDVKLSGDNNNLQVTVKPLEE